MDKMLKYCFDPAVSAGELVEILSELQKDGKVKCFGVSNWTRERIAEANDYAARKGLNPIRVSSPNFGLAKQICDPWGGGCVTISGPENEGMRIIRCWCWHIQALKAAFLGGF